MQGKHSWPATNADLAIQVTAGRLPIIEATAAIIHGSESVFARLQVNDMPNGDRARHSANFSLIGDRNAVLQTLARLYQAVREATPEREDTV